MLFVFISNDQPRGSLSKAAPMGVSRPTRVRLGPLFLTRLEDVEWECESVDLPSPNDIPQYYHAPGMSGAGRRRRHRKNHGKLERHHGGL